jgi:dipeptidase E
MELLLLSNSTNYGATMFSHAAEAFREVTAGATVTFVPYALADWDDYADRVEAAFGMLGIDVVSAHRADAPDRAICDADVVMMGGGNSFRLLDSLSGLGVMDQLGANVRAGTTRYMGASAGTNVACPTIRTTNDMPVIQPPSFAALSLVPFQINPHFTDQTIPNHGGETRSDRIMEFLVLNPGLRVVGLREGSWLDCDGSTLSLHGPHPMAVFEAGQERREVEPGSELSFLLAPPG